MDKKKTLYLIGSLRNKDIPHLAKKLREETKLEIFDDWFSPGPEADDFWRDFEKVRGSSYKEALNNWAAKHVYYFDKEHIDRSNFGVLVMPAGKSGHLELGYMIGAGKTCYILFEEEPERWDVMYQFAKDIFFSVDELIAQLKKDMEILEVSKEEKEDLMLQKIVDVINYNRKTLGDLPLTVADLKSKYNSFCTRTTLSDLTQL